MLAALLALTAAAAAAPRQLQPPPPPPPLPLQGTPAVPADFEQMWHNQTIDHFNFSPRSGAGAGTFGQRYYVAAEHWDKETGPILFYAGNEGRNTRKSTLREGCFP